MSYLSRRQILQGASLVAAGAMLPTPEVEARPAQGSHPAVVTPNGVSLPWHMDNGFKVFHLVAEPVKREFAPGLVVSCWGYNGHTPGPTIEAVEGDRVRIFVTNHLPEVTTIHWHGMILPNGMDGVAGLTQKPIEPGETYVYEFTLRQHGTLMYHPHADEMTQIAMGMAGFFIIHPRTVEDRVDRDFAIMLAEWKIPADTATPVTSEMTDFNYFTFNSKVYPATSPLVVKRGERVRIRLGNLSMDSHPLHIHGHLFRITGTPGGRIPAAGQMPEATVDVPVGTTRDLEFVADNDGDWPFHCHKTHHTMNGMVHDLPNLLGVEQGGDKLQKLLPDTMAMGDKGMAEMSEMQLPGQTMSGMDMSLPKNTVPMGSAPGPHGVISMGGMFTLLKVRPHLTSYDDPGWYRAPAGTSAHRVAAHVTVYTCPMHPEVRSLKPGHCPRCGMKLVPLR
jgi:hypothetical protein